MSAPGCCKGSTYQAGNENPGHPNVVDHGVSGQIDQIDRDRSEAERQQTDAHEKAYGPQQRHDANFHLPQLLLHFRPLIENEFTFNECSITGVRRPPGLKCALCEALQSHFFSGRKPLVAGTAKSQSYKLLLRALTNRYESSTSSLIKSSGTPMPSVIVIQCFLFM